MNKESIEFYFYNISRDCVDKLKSLTSGLGDWFTARSCLLSSIVSQKLGLFHNQTFLRTQKKPLRERIGERGQVENLLKYNSPGAVPTGKSKPEELADFQFVYRNAKVDYPDKKRLAGTDILMEAGKQIHRINNSESKQYLQALYHLWNSRGENCSVNYTEDLIKYFKQKSRMLHYVFTPLLFLPQWRMNANKTRDHGADSHSQTTAEEEPSSKPTASSVQSEKTRHTSGNSFQKEKTKRSKSVTSQSGFYASSPTGKSPTGSPKPVRVNLDEKFHLDLVSNFFQEYEQYLQTLGFTLINISHPKVTRKTRNSIESSVDRPVLRRRTATSSSKMKSKVVYLQKSLLGGLLIFEIGVSEPFFYTKFHALEAQRLHLSLSNHNISHRNFTTTFLEECDNIKLLIHLHSFTYDYHLRTVSGYIGQKPSQLRKGFHIVSFLEDFMKYYSKGPNFARNFIHTGVLHIISQVNKTR